MAEKKIEPVFSPWSILAVLVVTIVGFVGATQLAQWTASGVNDDAISIATNASPAIANLSNARVELVRIALAAASAVSTQGDVETSDVATLAAALPALRDDLSRYLKQPFYPREDLRYAEVDRTVGVLAARTSQFRGAVAAGDRRGAAEVLRSSLLPAIDRVDRALSGLVRFNAEQQRQLALEIPRQRQRAHAIGYWLQAITAVLGVILMIFVIRGIRDYARLLVRARAASRARDDLLATVSHDLRNPINVVKLAVHGLHRASRDAAIMKQAARIEHAVERMSRFIEDLLDAAKIEAGVLEVERQPEDASGLIESAVEMFRPVAEEKSVRLLLRPPAGAAVVVCERHLILRVLSNVIGNALKFSPQDGSIVVRGESLPGEVRFSVSDQGPGIPPEHRPHVFDRYWQREKADRRGTGLGLYIAKGIVDAHGGRIWIETTGPGTTVSFTLPGD